MNGFPSKEIVERLRRQYPKGTRVELVSMNDPFTKLKPGDRGRPMESDRIRVKAVPRSEVDVRKMTLALISLAKDIEKKKRA